MICIAEDHQLEKQASKKQACLKAKRHKVQSRKREQASKAAEQLDSLVKVTEKAKTNQALAPNHAVFLFTLHHFVMRKLIFFVIVYLQTRREHQ